MFDHEKYISMRHFARLAGCHPMSVPKVAETAGVRIRQLPGMPTRYHLGDVEALVARAYRVAGQEHSQAVAG